MRVGLRRGAASAGALALALVSGCAGGSVPGASSRTVSYWLWDANQLPAYQACARGFEQDNPGLDVRITQMGWDDYWTKLTASLIAGTQPDVFTDHISKFGQLAELKVLEPLDGLGLKDDAYQPGLAANWTGQDGHRYGAPKDWDTVALVYDTKRAKAAGLDADQLENLSWNPKDGGTFEKAIARLTVDENGRRGDEPGFDRSHVKVYGLASNGGGDGDGQTQWSTFAASAGWTYTDKKRWGTAYRYDSATFTSVVSWYFGLVKKGYMVPISAFNSQSNPANVQVASGQAAAAFDGAWMISTYAGMKGVDAATARTPTGPTGERATMLNGLADSVTRNARNKAGALTWVRYLASDDCQKKVGSYGIVLPATPAGTDAAVAAYRKKGVDMSAFTEPVTDPADSTTFSFPITDHSADVFALMHPAMQDVYASGGSVAGLSSTNRQINLILGQ
ncbi:ABC transporter substrate-binding protein [Streptomyces sp. NPDC087425]|uniref:ABC transporter substrate-binding protein n=1 Tax=Streptomyces sp. NPDC087425 TaxID=3365787 RepID=UPI0038223DC3